MNKKLDLHSQVSDLNDREQYIAESQGITKQDARDIIKGSSFSEYVTMVEANADRGFVGTQTTQSGMAQPTSTDQEMNTPRTPTTANKDTEVDSKELDNAINDISSPTKRNELERIRDKMDTDPDSAKQDLEDFQRLNPDLADDNSVLGQFFGNMKSGFMQGFANGMRTESYELNRIRELAGLTESATAGATASGNIASTPSIVGDTSDSHKPSVKLRRNNRLEREEKKKEKAKRDKQKQKDDDNEESEISRLIKR